MDVVFTIEKIKEAFVEVRELLKGEWLEYSGGSRPDTNKIRFVDLGGDTVYIELCYIFDWNTLETQHVGFRLTRAQFDGLVEGLLEKGHATVDVKGENESLFFEWKQTETGLAFRLRGHTISPLGGPIGIELTDFRSVHCGHLTRN